MRLGIALFIALWAQSAYSQAATICRIDDALLFGFKTVAWSGDLERATVTDLFDEEYPATVTSVREHDPGGWKINLVVRFPTRHYGTDVAELAIFTLGAREHGAIGAQYVIADGELHLNTVSGGTAADCTSF